MVIDQDVCTGCQAKQVQVHTVHVDNAIPTEHSMQTGKPTMKVYVLNSYQPWVRRIELFLSKTVSNPSFLCMLCMLRFRPIMLEYSIFSHSTDFLHISSSLRFHPIKWDHLLSLLRHIKLSLLMVVKDNLLFSLTKTH
jgi:hypothetical protein